MEIFNAFEWQLVGWGNLIARGKQRRSLCEES